MIKERIMGPSDFFFKCTYSDLQRGISITHQVTQGQEIEPFQASGGGLRADSHRLSSYRNHNTKRPAYRHPQMHAGTANPQPIEERKRLWILCDILEGLIASTS
jgi:hypothetical protein